MADLDGDVSSRGAPGTSQKMLTQQLRQREQDNLARRKVYAEVPPRGVFAHRDRQEPQPDP